MKHPWRRIGAYLIDYCVILIWMAALAVFAQTGLLRLSEIGDNQFWPRLALQAQAFLILTLPVYLYFTLSESFGWTGTIGKRLTRLQVKGSPPQKIFRNILKFLPWELAHTAIWHGMDVPFQSDPSQLAWILFATSLGLSMLYVSGLFIGQGRPLYDRLAGTVVILSDR